MGYTGSATGCVSPTGHIFLTGQDDMLPNTPSPPSPIHLRVGVYLAPDIPQSFRVYAENVLAHFPALGVEPIPFADSATLPRQADVLWDIRSGGGNAPIEFMRGGPPLVVTVHGFAPISLSGWEYFRNVRGALMSRRWARQKIQAWRQCGDMVHSLIAVSEFTRQEAARYTGIPGHRIAVCPHGVAAHNFTPAIDHRRERYFLHVSNNEPRKNLGRVVRAFARLRRVQNVELLLKLPSDQARHYENLPGVRVIAGMLGTDALAELYRRALGFLFPSLYEGFGLPILEAMASGCPVITSSASACPEVAGDAALVIDPRDENALLQAMHTLADHSQECERLATAGLAHMQGFTWLRSAQCHAQVLRAAADTKS